MMAKPSSGQALWQSVVAVLWSFLGIRRRSGFEQDTQKLNPFVVVVVGLAIALMFVLGLIALVNWVVATPLS